MVGGGTAALTDWAGVGAAAITTRRAARAGNPGCDTGGFGSNCYIAAAIANPPAIAPQ